MTVARSNSRIPALDFTKGALVLIMVLYHWLNYFVSTEGFFYTYLRFLTPSFIFITGFLISHVYLGTSRTADWRVPTRLMQRGLKILAVFIVLNVVRTFLIPDARSDLMRSDPWAVDNMIAIFITGNVGANSRAAAFNVLVPISYLLLLSAGLVTITRLYRHAFHAACLVSLICIVLLRVYGLEYGNLELIAIGLLGVSVGYIPIERINAVLERPYWLAAAYLCYVWAITVWGAIYSLQIFGVPLCLMMLYLVGTRGRPFDWLRGHTILLGRYSLFGYIAQIAILQVLYRVFRSVDIGVAAMGISFLAAIVLTILAVVILDRARATLTPVDKLYKAVFA